jgi:hypothetical protein
LQQEILKGNVNPLMKRCFFMVLCNRLLLPSSSNFIGSVDIKRTVDHQFFGVVDWSQAVFNDLQIAVLSWHDRDKNQLTQNIYGCAIFLLVIFFSSITLLIYFLQLLYHLTIHGCANFFVNRYTILILITHSLGTKGPLRIILETVDAKVDLQTQRANTRNRYPKRASRFDLLIDKDEDTSTLVLTTAIRPEVTAKRYSRGTRGSSKIALKQCNSPNR